MLTRETGRGGSDILCLRGFGHWKGFVLKIFKMFIFSVLSLPLAAFAFDPMTIAAGMQAVSSIMGSLDKVDEMADLGFAFGDLLGELGVETGSEEEISRSVGRLEELNRKAQDLKWSGQDIRQALQSDLNSANSLKDKLKALRNMISASKRIATIMGVRPKAGVAATQIQNIKINSMILEELQAQRRQQFLVYLEAREAQTKRAIFIQEIQENERGKNPWSNR
jgi:hypothetical protein